LEHRNQWNSRGGVRSPYLHQRHIFPLDKIALTYDSEAPFQAPSGAGPSCGLAPNQPRAKNGELATRLILFRFQDETNCAMFGSMARPRKIDSELVKKAQELAAQTNDIQELRMAQAILLPAMAQLTLKAAAKVIGVGRATVARLQSRFRRRKGGAPSTPRPWGGRRRALLPLQEEQAFLAGWKSKAEQGQLVVVTPLQVALQEKLGRRIKPSVVYRLLDRHRWRKVAPDTRHPKAQPTVQEEWKKKRFQKSWRPC